jgi:hypothetical protein
MSQEELLSKGVGLILRKQLDEQRTITKPGGVLNLATNQVETLFCMTWIDISHLFLSVL